MPTLTYRLPEICEIRSGYRFRRGLQGSMLPTPRASSTKTGARAGKATPARGVPVRVIQIKDLEGGQLSASDLERAQVRVVAPYQVQLHDILLLARGYRFGATLVETPLPEDTVATNHFFILRVLARSRVTPAFLAWYLNRPQVQNLLLSRATKTHIPLAARSDLEALTVEVPSLQTQHYIMELDELRQQEADATRRLLDNHARMIEAITERALREDGEGQKGEAKR